MDGLYEALFGCHGIRILGKSLIKRSQRSDMTIAVVWDNKTAQVVKDQEKAQSEKKFPLEKTEVGSIPYQFRQ